MENINFGQLREKNPTGGVYGRSMVPADAGLAAMKAALTLG